MGASSPAGGGGNGNNDGRDEKPTLNLPVLLLTNGVLLPEARLKIPIRSKTNVAMLEQYVVNRIPSSKSLVLLAYRVEDASKKVHDVGTIALVEQLVCWNLNGHVQYTLHLVGLSRALITHFQTPLCSVQQLHSKFANDLDEKTAKEFGDAVRLATTLLDWATARSMRSMIDEKRWAELSDMACAHCDQVGYADMLGVLAELDVRARVRLVAPFLLEWVQLRSSRDNPNNSSSPLRDSLRELIDGKHAKMAINARLIPTHNGQGDGSPVNMPSNGGGGGSGGGHSQEEPLEQRLLQAGIPEQSLKRVMDDYQKYKGMSKQSAEHSMLRNYLELCADLPWAKMTPDSVDMTKARRELDAGHDGMESVKKRVLEFLAVRQLAADSNNVQLKAPILCFSGPPGIGKTSVARAIAATLGRKFERISLGGVRDESEIRGHRRTYVGALPGRIVQAIRHAGSRNPVILLDEVDKLCHGGHSGNPAAALLEVLDPEQNHAFVDHYLNVPFDLSQVVFVATANDVSQLDRPLLDRMELVEMSGYSTSEKLSIASRHLVSRQVVAHGCCPDHVQFTEDGLLAIVEGYTREAGVRQLERSIAAVCRHAALKLAEALNGGQPDADAVCTSVELPLLVDRTAVHNILGQPRYVPEEIERRAKRHRPGVAFGLAWTPFGGEVMIIETSRASTSSSGGHAGAAGRVTMTGKLGDVLRESVDVARSWLRANAQRHGLDDCSMSELHVHLPSGAVGKDGPSAGCAIVAALASLLSNEQRCVRPDTAVTGEISLVGDVLPVGGIREKVLAAHRAGLRRVVLPAENRRHTEELDDAIRRDMEFVFVADIDTLLHELLEPVKFVVSKL